MVKYCIFYTDKSLKYTVVEMYCSWIGVWFVMDLDGVKMKKGWFKCLKSYLPSLKLNGKEMYANLERS